MEGKIYDYLWVGMGCQRGVGPEGIAAAVQQVLALYGLEEGRIAAVGTIDRKMQEAGIVEFCRDRGLPLRFFAAEVLQAVQVPGKSAAVAAAMGTASVAEAAAVLALIRDCFPQVSPLAALPFCPQLCLVVPKQVIRVAGSSRSVTIAIAQIGAESLH